MMNDPKSETNGHSRPARRRTRRPANAASDAFAEQGLDPRAALETLVQDLPALVRAHPVIAAAVGAGAALAVGLVLRSRLGRTLLMLAGGYVVQQLLAPREDAGIEAELDEQ